MECIDNIIERAVDNIGVHVLGVENLQSVNGRYNVAPMIDSPLTDTVNGVGREVESMSIYDVCNDYSLDPVEKAFKFSEYKLTKFRTGYLLIHKEYQEIHYFIGPDGLSGMNLYSL